MKTCSLCRESKPLSEFNKNKRQKDGHGVWCRECVKSKNRTEYRHKNEDWKRRNPKKMMLTGAKTGARLRALEFSITIDDFEIPQNCPVLGIPLTPRRSGKRDDGTPTIDRIDNNRGYVPDNIIVISWRANRIKSDATLAELQSIVAFYNNIQDNTDANHDRNG